MILSRNEAGTKPVRWNWSEIYLFGIVQRGVDLVLYGTNSSAKGVVYRNIVCACLEQFMGKIEGSHYSNAVGADNFATISDFLHFFTEEARRNHECLLFFRWAGDPVFLIQEVNGYCA